MHGQKVCMKCDNYANNFIGNICISCFDKYRSRSEEEFKRAEKEAEKKAAEEEERKARQRSREKEFSFTSNYETKFEYGFDPSADSQKYTEAEDWFQDLLRRIKEMQDDAFKGTYTSGEAFYEEWKRDKRNKQRQQEQKEEPKKTATVDSVTDAYCVVRMRESTIKDLLMLCHPDKHGNSKLSNKVTRWLIAIKKEIEKRKS